MMRSTTSLAAAVLLVLGAAAPAAAAAPPGPACGDTVTGEVHLTRNLTCTTVGLVLAPGAVLDLDGHTLRGPGPVAGWALQTDVESTVPGEAPVTVRDGRVMGWAQVLGAEAGVLDVVVEDVRFTHNGTVMFAEQVHAVVERSRFADNATAINGLGGAVEVWDSTFVRNEVTALNLGPYYPSIQVTGSRFADNGLAVGCSEGRVVVDSTTLRRNDAGVSSGWCEMTLTGSTLADNEVGLRTRMVSPTFQGLVDTISGNLFVRNGIGADLAVGATVADNTFLRNGRGLYSETAEGVPVEQMVLAGNTAHRNELDGIWVDTTGTVEVQGNAANHNGGQGIVVPHATDLGGNTARGNGVEPQCVGVVCAPRS
ncbi:right-handed parallel beta-helix repeat-containing protein [Actinotalea solisilvae]|uniref:right-handed parallel beta-helix repeat-containing protein n=1 Tax=Actinotalea solisilvae TaxID=2072922 RepID=UPI0018F15F1E|nr:right-handed parallel beta-helix repeat-containing protein [Actinotalea solisilvae]